MAEELKSMDKVDVISDAVDDGAPKSTAKIKYIKSTDFCDVLEINGKIFTICHGC